MSLLYGIGVQPNFWVTLHTIIVRDGKRDRENFTRKKMHEWYGYSSVLPKHVPCFLTKDCFIGCNCVDTIILILKILGFSVTLLLAITLNLFYMDFHSATNDSYKKITTFQLRMIEKCES